MARFFRIRHKDGEGYQIMHEQYAVRLTDLDGNTIEPSGYITVEMDVPAPSWYVAPPSPDPEPEPQPSERRITVFAFRARFTTAEKIALETAAQGVPSASSSDPRNVFAMRLRASEKDLQAARNVDLDLEATREGTLALEQVGILGAGRGVRHRPPACARGRGHADADAGCVDAVHAGRRARAGRADAGRHERWRRPREGSAEKEEAHLARRADNRTRPA